MELPAVRSLEPKAQISSTTQLLQWLHGKQQHHVTIVAIERGLLKRCWPMIIGCVLRTAGSYLKLFIPAFFVRTTQLLPHPSNG